MKPALGVRLGRVASGRSPRSPREGVEPLEGPWSGCEVATGCGSCVALFFFFAVFGAFALFLSARGEFLPHDIRFLGASASELCSLAQCRIV